LFKEIFVLGGNVFLIALGAQLVNASQILIISNTLDLTAAAVWSVATKPFIMAQQLVSRLAVFSSSPMSEMIVRGESQRFVKRFKDLVIVYAAAAIFVGGVIALCNESFLGLWLRQREILPDIRANWNTGNDFLLALWLAVTCVTTLHVGAVTYTKKIGRMRYVYFCEGILFIASAFFIVSFSGIQGVIAAAIVANVVCSGIFGFRSTKNSFGVPLCDSVFNWMTGPFKLLLLFTLILFSCHFLTASLPILPRFIVNAAISVTTGLWLMWHIGLNIELRHELKSIVRRILIWTKRPAGI
jgi:hypothetical protein